jgi:hypothetical protein
LSKGLADDASKVEWRKPQELKDDFGVDFHPGTVSYQFEADGYS